MSNTFETGDPDRALRLLLAHVLNPSLLEGGVPSWTGSTLTTDTFATVALVHNVARNELIIANQRAVAIGPLNQGDGIYYLAIHRDIHTQVSSWQRQANTHYLWQRTGSGSLDTPTLDVDGEITLGALTVAGGQITGFEALTYVGTQLRVPTFTREQTQPVGSHGDIRLLRQGTNDRESVLQWDLGGGVGDQPGRQAAMQFLNDFAQGLFKIHSNGLPAALQLAIESTGTLRLQTHDSSPVILIGSGSGAYNLRSGSGSPEGVVTGSPPDIYLNGSGGAGTTLYVKESGVSTNTGWVGK